MKTTAIYAVMVAHYAGAFASDVQTSSAPPAPLVAKYDANGNGKIDVEDRKGYIRERAKRLREEAQREAAKRPVVPLGVRLFLEPPNWTPEKVARYDASKDGRLDLEERRQERLDAVKTAEAKFKQADTNGDGRLDAAECRAAFARKP